jgi:hypothetical protein
MYTAEKSQSDSIAVAKVDGKTYKAVYNSDETLSILDFKGKTVLLLKAQTLIWNDFRT